MQEALLNCTLALTPCSELALYHFHSNTVGTSKSHDQAVNEQALYHFHSNTIGTGTSLDQAVNEQGKSLCLQGSTQVYIVKDIYL